jgi:DNA-binding ferritin-like protein
LNRTVVDHLNAELATRFIQIHQKEAWFLREMLG